MTRTYDDNKIIDDAFKDLLKYCNRSQKKENEELLLKGFRFANNAHKGVKRKSGLPYIVHPIAVAKIVAYEIGLGTEAVVTALLHDVVEDTHYTIEDIENTFGKKIAYMVDGLTKIDDVFDTEITKQAENFKKMLLTLSDDIRVIIIKIADRLHNMRTLEFMAEHKQIKIATETLTVFAPLAHRFGLRTIRKELETLSFKYRNKKEYNEIEKKLLSSEEEVNKITSAFSKPIQERLDKAGYDYSILGRQKSIYSIWRKMQEEDCTFDDLFNKLVVRIIFTPKENISEITQCWDIHRIILERYKPDKTKTKDWINYPRPTGYEALHVTVMADDGNWIEVQICSKRMNRIAEHGTTANYWKKQEGKEDSALDKWLDEVQVIFENPESDALSFLDDFKLELYYDDIQVFTPKGNIISLPQGATVVDFAYKIHSDLGNKCIGAKVNKKLEAPSYKLSNGEQVEILTLKTQEPQREWLDFIATARAKTRIKSFFKDERIEKIKEGQLILEHIFTKNDYPRLDAEAIRKILRNLNIKQKDNLYLGVANKTVTEADIKKAFFRSGKVGFGTYFRIIPNPLKRKQPKKKEMPKATTTTSKSKATFTLRDDKVDQEYKIAKCCSPIPGDEVIAYIDLQEQMIVHKKKCSRILQISSRKNSALIPVSWETKRIKSFIARISVKGVDSHGIVNKISNVISNEHKVNMKSIAISEKNGLFHGDVKLYVPHIKDLNNMVRKLLEIEGMIEIKRKETI